MFVTLTKFLKNKEITYSVLENQNVAVFGIKTEKGNYQCVADVKEESTIFVFYTVLGIVVPKDKILIMCELLTKINYGILIGNFEMDFDDGELRYKTSIDYEGTELTENLIENTIGANISIVDTYFQAILEQNISSLSANEILDKYE